MIYLPIIQVIIPIKENLSEYYQKVSGKKSNILYLLDLHDLEAELNQYCPICGRKDCANFFQYYTRIVIDEKGRTYTDFPIARFKCNLYPNRTFSLLPYQLIPYHKYSIEFIFKTLRLKYIEKKSISIILNVLDNLDEDNTSLLLDRSRIIDLEKLIRQGLDKVSALSYYPDFTIEKCGAELLVKFIEYSESFECVKTSWELKGPCGLSYDFYLNGGGYYQKAQFLFGRPSQFRFKGS